MKKSSLNKQSKSVIPVLKKELEISHYLPVKPISVNECWQGRRFKTRKYDAFIQEMLYLMPKQNMIRGNSEVEIIFNLKSIVKGDLDNLIKPLLDCLVKKGWIEDDRFIQKLIVWKVKGNKDGMLIKIKELKNL